MSDMAGKDGKNGANAKGAVEIQRRIIMTCNRRRSLVSKSKEAARIEVVFRPLKPGLRRGTLIKQHAESSIQSKEVPLATMQRHVGSVFSASFAVKTSQIRNLNGANGMSDMAG